MSTQDKNKQSFKAAKPSSNINISDKISSSKSKEYQKKNNPKKLTLTNLNKLASKFNEKRTVVINVDGEDYEVTITENFRETDIRKIYVQFMKIIFELKRMKDIDEEDLLNASYLLGTLILKEFTNLPIPKLDDIRKLVRVTLNLYDLGITKALLGDNNPFKKESLDLLNRVLSQTSEGIGKALSELGLIAELNEIERNKIDVDGYFSELEMRDFEIAEDEDLSLLLRVIDQLNEDGTYDEYMGKLTTEELDKLKERLDLLETVESSEDHGTEV